MENISIIQNTFYVEWWVKITSSLFSPFLPITFIIKKIKFFFPPPSGNSILVCFQYLFPVPFHFMAHHFIYGLVWINGVVTEIWCRFPVKMASEYAFTETDIDMFIISAVKRHKSRCHLQHHKAREVGKRIIRYVGDLVEGQRHCLQRGQGVQSRHRYFC